MLFKFISERPSPSVIWQTLSDTTITPSAGYTVHQIRFMMFIILVMHDFKEAKQMCNDFLGSKPAPIFTAIKKYLDVSDSDIKSILEPPADLPSFVDAPLYVPYYMLMQLKVPFDSPLWLEPFDRPMMSKRESEYIAANYLPLDVSITAYKLWLTHEPTVVVEYYSRIFQIEMSQPPAFITSKDDLIMALNGELLEYLDYHTIYTYEEKIHITPFQLGGPNAPS